MSKNVTALERKILIAIRTSEYQDATEEKDYIGHHVWSHYLCHDLLPRHLSGVIASLSKKRLVTTDREGKDATIALTQAGLDASKETQQSSEELIQE